MLVVKWLAIFGKIVDINKLFFQINPLLCIIIIHKF